MKKPGAGPASRIARRDVLMAAKRYYDLGHTQADIAADMGVSPSYLARLLKQAKDAGWVRVFIDTDRELELAAKIKAKYPHLRHVDVVPSGPTPEATALSVATAMATWFNAVLDEDEEREEPRIRNVAIGGAWTHRLMVDQVVQRRNRISVGPTALTPFRGKVARWTASTVAMQLAGRLGALEAGSAAPPDATRTGFYYDLSVDPPRDSMNELREWFARLHEREEYRTMQEFWDSCDIVLASVVGMDHVYRDVRERLVALGTSVGELKEKGAVAVVANQFVDAGGRVVPLADGVLGYEPAIKLTNRMVLDGWGEKVGRLQGGIGHAFVFFCDLEGWKIGSA